MARRTREVPRSAMALRGAVALLVVAAGAVFAVGGTELVTSAPVLTVRIPPEAGPVRPNSSVQYRGTAVGRLAAVQPASGGARLTLAVDAGALRRVPAGVRVRVLPKTLFGDQVIELSSPPGVPPSPTRLFPGAVLQADTGPQTVQLYHVYTRLYELVDRLRPAELQVALSTVAEALRGRGADLGRTIDAADSLSRQLDPGRTGQAGTDLADITRQLARSTPDVLRALDDAVSLSRTAVREHRGIERLLTSGTQLAERSQELVADNGSRAVRVVHLLDPVTRALADNPTGPRSSVDNLTRLFRDGSRTFRGGRFQIRAPLTFQDPQPYGPRDCPRYPGADGPNCGPEPAAAGGTTGPVGGPEEKAALRELLPQLPAPPGAPAAAAPPPSGAAELLAGPVVRGTQVVLR